MSCILNLKTLIKQGLSFFIIGVLVFVSLKLEGQKDSLMVKDTFTEQFISPVKHTLRLAGSFGEIRTNHFHGGIDIKSTNGKEGDTLLASMSGLVSRIKVQTGSYGKVLYIDHPNGYTTVYAHLKKFEPRIDSFIQQKQLEAKSYEVDIYPEKGRFEFSQGQYIGLMGNTGRSYGPHLHFEIRKTVEEIPVNPYLFNIGPEDNKLPKLYAFDIHGLNDSFQKIWSKSQKIIGNLKGVYEPQITIEVPAWRVGVGIQTFDMMNGAKNKNGIYSITLYVNDTIHFSHVMDEVGFDVTGYINSHIDYYEKKKNNRTVTKCYVAPGNKLSFYPNTVNNGLIPLYKSKTTKVKVEVKDFKGNTSSYTCRLKRREPKEGEIADAVFQKHLKFNEASDFKLGSCRFFFGEGMLDKDTYIKYEEKKDTTFSFTLNEYSDPLFGYPVVSIPLGSIDSTLWSKTILVHDSKFSYGGSVDSDSLRVRIGAFGNFEMVVDTFPPELVVGSFLSQAVGKPFFRFEVKDNYESKGYTNDIKYDVFIDGKWVIAPLKTLNHTLIIPLDKIESGDHHLKIRLEDHSGNVKIWERDFKN